MTEVGSMKAVEVVLLLAAGGLFVWWQLRDLRQAKQQSEEKARQAKAAPPAEAPNESPP